MIGIDLFAGSGGMSLGASRSGIDVKLAIEKDKYAIETYRSNHKQTVVIQEDIANIKSFEFANWAGAVVVFGGPPCQGYSISNQKTRSVNNPNNWLFEHYIRCVKLIMPDWVVIENVKGIVNLNRGFFLNQIIENLEAKGYTVTHKVLNAVDFAVPQKRERVFIVGSLHGIVYQFPKKSTRKPITVGESIYDLPELENGDSFHQLPYKANNSSSYTIEMRGESEVSTCNYVSRNSDLVVERYRHIPQGSNWKSIPSELMANYKDHTRCHSGIYRRLLENEPSIVIGNFRKNMLIHPKSNRGLSIREAARLQSFPDDYLFRGPLIAQQQQVGDAVPPKLAAAVFNKIMDYM